MSHLASQLREIIQLPSGLPISQEAASYLAEHLILTPMQQEAYNNLSRGYMLDTGLTERQDCQVQQLMQEQPNLFESSSSR